MRSQGRWKQQAPLPGQDAPASPKEEGPRQPPGLIPTLQEAAQGVAVGQHPLLGRAWLRRAGRPILTSLSVSERK